MAEHTKYRAEYLAGYRTQRQGSFFRPAVHPYDPEKQSAWDQGYRHAAYNEQHGLQHLSTESECNKRMEVRP